MFCTFWLRHVLRATTACNFSSLIWPAGSVPAALASRLFDPPVPQIIGKTKCFATYLPVRASAPSFFWLFLFSDLLSSNLSLLSAASARLCFSSVNIVGSLTSKLPSTMCCWLYSSLGYLFCQHYLMGSVCDAQWNSWGWRRQTGSRRWKSLAPLRTCAPSRVDEEGRGSTHAETRGRSLVRASGTRTTEDWRCRTLIRRLMTRGCSQWSRSQELPDRRWPREFFRPSRRRDRNRHGPCPWTYGRTGTRASLLPPQAHIRYNSTSNNQQQWRFIRFAGVQSHRDGDQWDSPRTWVASELWDSTPELWPVTDRKPYGGFLKMRVPNSWMGKFLTKIEDLGVPPWRNGNLHMFSTIECLSCVMKR